MLHFVFLILLVFDLLFSICVSNPEIQCPFNFGPPFYFGICNFEFFYGLRFYEIMVLFKRDFEGIFERTLHYWTSEGPWAVPIHQHVQRHVSFHVTFFLMDIGKDQREDRGESLSKANKKENHFLQ